MEPQATEKNLQRLLAIEDGRRRNFNRNASTRHSRFGTTISVTVNPKKTEKGPNEGGAAGQNPDSTGSKAFVLHRQQAINRDTGNLLDMTSGKRSKAQKGKKVDELGREDNLSVDAKSTLQEVAKMFTETCFNGTLLISHAPLNFLNIRFPKRFWHPC